MIDIPTDFIPPYTAPVHVRRSGMVMIWIGFAMPLIVYAAVVFFAPLDVLERYSILRDFANAVQSWVFSKSSLLDIHKHARSTLFPQVAMLASAMGVCMIGLMSALMIIQTCFFYRHLAPLFRVDKRTLKDWAAGLVLIPVTGLACWWAVFCVKGDWSFNPGLTTHGRGGYFFISSLAIIYVGGGIGLWLMQVRLFLSNIFSKE